MEHLKDWFMVLTSKMHFPLIAGLMLCFKKEEKSTFLDLGDLGDNVPHVFFKNLH
ncbi:MAG: hypothetical protein HY761_03210 [Candidatus Omnitrophica bacterium]|nr:hypothetical protein [Candidatus Omnitrophota bacterium]